MRFSDLNFNYKVSVSEFEIDAFNSRWPCSELRGLTGVTFVFEKKTGDLVDIVYKNGNSDRWDGEALTALCSDAKEYAEIKLKEKR